MTYECFNQQTIDAKFSEVQWAIDRLTEALFGLKREQFVSAQYSLTTLRDRHRSIVRPQGVIDDRGPVKKPDVSPPTVNAVPRKWRDVTAVDGPVFSHMSALYLGAFAATKNGKPLPYRVSTCRGVECGRELSHDLVRWEWSRTYYTQIDRMGDDLRRWVQTRVRTYYQLQMIENDCERELEHAKAELRRYADALAASRDNGTHLKIDNDRLQNENSSLKNHHTQLENRIAHLENRLAAAHQAITGGPQ